MASERLTRRSKNTRVLPHSPIGTIANEFDGLKVALQRFPPGRSAGCSALSHTENTKRENNEGPSFSSVWKNKNQRTLQWQLDCVKQFFWRYCGASRTPPPPRLVTTLIQVSSYMCRRCFSGVVGVSAWCSVTGTGLLQLDHLCNSNMTDRQIRTRSQRKREVMLRLLYQSQFH